MSRLADTRGQSEVLGFILIIGISLTVTVSVLAFGAVALDDVRSQSEIDRVENAMTQFDSETSTVALGDADRRNVPFGQSPDTYRVDESAGRITIKHENYNDTGETETIFEGQLGAVLYEASDGTVIGYQGGGVWRKGPTGEARMVSPPEFHYRGATLTLPVITVEGDSAKSGNVRANVRKNVTGVSMFPHEEKLYNKTDDEYVNPITGGDVTIVIESQFYEAWETYFNGRTEGEVTVDHENESVEVELITLGALGEFIMPGEGESLSVRGLDEEPGALEEFEITLRPSSTDSADFSNLQWSLSAEEGDQRFEMAVRGGGSMECDAGNYVDVSLYYSNDSGETYEGWQSTNDFEIQCDESDNAYVTVEFANESVEVEPLKLQQADLVEFKPETLVEGHEDKAARSISNVTKDYFDHMGPDFDLRVNDRNGGVSESASGGYIDYDGNQRVVTYLHVTENRVEVDLE